MYSRTVGASRLKTTHQQLRLTHTARAGARPTERLSSRQRAASAHPSDILGTWPSLVLDPVEGLDSS
jgi:hypothetical protein